MFINGHPEYIVGELPGKSARRLSRRREKYSGFGFLTRYGATSSVGIGGTFGLLEVAGNSALVVFPVLGLIFATSIAGGAWVTAPDFRGFFVTRLVWDDKIIEVKDILYKLVLTEDVISWLLAEQANGQTNGNCKHAVDAFMQEFAQYRDRWNPERSELLTGKWEQEHGPLFEHPLVVAIQDAICDFDGNLQVHVYDLVEELKATRKQQLEEQLDELKQQQEKKLTEIEELKRTIDDQLAELESEKSLLDGE